ncbi:helix-turn-helix transcriptional regulator [Streptosporangium amethystogenes]|uniref:helix-turn-helix transcriptional regulator n=1 Tax=Streptosporangium amethystogenes TaxID=2002 RepID=UPI000A03054B|nr:WYL domain-containing protein [Streptosporangium amethystogenes]
MTSVMKLTTPLTAAEIAALALSMAHLGSGPQANAARSGLRHAFEQMEIDDDVVATTLTTLTEPMPAPIADRARTIANAITSGLVIRLHYRDVSGRITVRDVDPVTCMVHREYWYLVGMCRMRHGIRAFRFDRIVATEPTFMPARPHRAEGFLPFQGKRAA